MRNKKGQFKRVNPEHFICCVCGDKFKNKRGKKEMRYCSQDCFHNREIDSSKITIECAECGVLFRDWVSSDRKYCSQECSLENTSLTTREPFCK